MRGKDEQQLDVFSYTSPEQRVPQDHPLRSLRAMTDEALRGLQPRFNKLYAETGRPSIAPEKLLRALLHSGGYLVSSIAVADLNADGVKDLVVLNCAVSGSTDCSTTGAMVGVLLGKGDGTFRSAQSYPRGGLGESWSPVTVADYNNDGIPDLLVGNTCKVVGSRCPADATVSLFAGNGDGTFHSAVNYDSGGYSVGSIGVMDIYGDGKLDLVLGNWNSAAVLPGNGDGTFASLTVTLTTRMPALVSW
jgi:hypothetical protein